MARTADRARARMATVAWRGLPATGRRIEFPLCAIFTVDGDARLKGERIYYDRGAVLGQLGLFHEAARAFGKITTALSQPLPIARAYLRRPARPARSRPEPPAERPGR